MRSQSAILTDLVVTAEAIIIRPPVMLPPDLQDKLARVAREIREADLKPAEDVRLTSWAMALVHALEQWTEAHRRRATAERATMCLMAAGALLPLVRADTFTAFSNERGQRL